MFRLRNCKAGWKVLVTLTYPAEYVTNGRTVKAHVNTFVQDFRRMQARYYWALEFQKRGAPHVHILVDTWVDMERAKRRWFEIVGSGDAKHRSQGVQIQGVRNESGSERNRIVGYLYAYLDKAYQKTVPEGFEKVGRFWGGTREVIGEMYRVWVRANEHDARRALRVVRKWYEAKNRDWQEQKRARALGRGLAEPKFYKWKWKRPQGVTFWGGSAFFDELFWTGEIVEQGKRILKRVNPANFNIGGGLCHTLKAC
jgi:hypothetical protein